VKRAVGKQKHSVHTKKAYDDPISVGLEGELDGARYWMSTKTCG